jgi:ribonuclease R
MSSSSHDILGFVRRDGYEPLKLKALARKLGVPSSEYRAFRDTVKLLMQQGRLELAKNRTIRQPDPHGTVTGVFRGIRAGGGFVRPHVKEAGQWPDIYIAPASAKDAASGDEVLVRVTKRPSRPDRNPEGKILEIIERATHQFVGSYFEDGGSGFVRVDGTIFVEPISVGDPGAKGAKPGDKVVVEMVRFPSAGMPGEAVLTELLGARGAPGVDTLSIIREFGLPDKFFDDALVEARHQARQFEADVRTFEKGGGNLFPKWPERGYSEKTQEPLPSARYDFTDETIVTIDPTDARDFDDAVHVHRLDNGNWVLGVHIADVAHFVRPGTALDREARKRGTSVYLPDRVLPMLPEIISNGLASLQEGAIRFTRTVLMEFGEKGTLLHAEIMPSVIRVTKRFDYGTVMDCYEHPHKYHGKLAGEVRALLDQMRKLAGILRDRRRQKGFLELELPEVKLELNPDGRFKAAHLQVHDESHQIIEEFMLAANEAVAQYLADRDLLFIRRVHGDPDPYKLRAFAEFVRAIGYKIKKPQSRFELQAVLAQSIPRPDRYAVHYGLLRSMKRAVYSPEELGHYAIASDCYCHFTSPIRRFPDLLVHRLLDRTWRERASSGPNVDESELIALGEHCTFTERRAAQAEAELIKLKILQYLVDKIGLEMKAVITSVEEFGFFAQSVDYLIDGMVHVSTLADDYYRFESGTYTLEGRRSGRTYRLGDTITVRVTRVDLDRRQLDFQVLRRR